MRRLIEFFVRNVLFGDILTVAVIVLGILAMFNIRREMFHNVEFDVITVGTVYSGASAEEVEKLITNKIEQQIKEVVGIKRLQSFSIEGRSSIVIFLDPDQTTDQKAKDEIKDAVDKVILPDDAEDPKITILESKQTPLIEVSVGGDIPALELRAIAKSVEKRLEDLDGVAQVLPQGLRDLEIRIEVSLEKLARFRLSLQDVVDALRKQNVSVPGGSIETQPEGRPSKEFIVRTVGEFQSEEDVRKTVIRSNDFGGTIRVSDVANVFMDLEKETILYRTNGETSIGLTVLKMEKADAINVVESVRKEVDAIRADLDPRAKLTLVNDFSYFISRRLNILTGNLGIGLFLVLAMLPLLIPFRFCLLVGLGEPFAFLGAILLLFAFDQSINLVSMIGLIMVSGILVDDSIVVTENAVRLIEKEHKSPQEAAIEGTLQILGPVSASVLTTAVAFLPMLFMGGIFGKFVSQIPIAVLTCLAISLFETLFILPAHVSHWIKTRKTVSTKKPNAFERGLNVSRSFWDQKVEPLYLRYLDISLHRRYWIALGLVGLMVGSLVLAVKVIPFILFPEEGVESFIIRVDAPVGTSLSRSLELVRPIEVEVAKLPKSELLDFVTTVGIQQQEPNDPETRRGSQYSQVQVFLTPETKRPRHQREIEAELRKAIGTPEGVETLSFEAIRTGPPVGKPISLGVRGTEYQDIRRAVEELKVLVGQVEGATDIRDSFVLGKPELRLQINDVEAAASNLSASQIGTTVRAAFEGLVATTMNRLDDEIDLRVSLPKEERQETTSVENLLVPNALGNLVPLRRVARIEPSQQIAVYEHEDHFRQVKVLGSVDETKTSSRAVNDAVRTMLPEFLKRHPGIQVYFGGEDRDTVESFESLGRAALLAVAGIFLILVLTFKQLVQPLLILLTIPLGLIATIFAFFVHGMPLSFFAMLGGIALSGVIVGNAVVFVDFVNQRRRLGVDEMTSIHQAARVRLRPIFLTSITTTIGVLPTAYGLGGLDMFVVPIAMALGWGLFFGAILQAFVFPASLAILDDYRRWLRRHFPRLANFYEDSESSATQST